MKRREFTAAAVLATGAGLIGETARAAGLTESEAAAGVRGALERGAVSAVRSLGVTDGFLGNPKVRIPLPGFLRNTARLLRATGQGHQVDELETAMNRAAEAAVPEATNLLMNAIQSISVDDALKLVHGKDTAVTDYFVAKTRAPLAEKFLPIVTQATEKVSLAERYNAVASKARGLGLVKPEESNVQQYVTAKALDGLYLMIGEEEKKIRADPLQAGSSLLKKVFGG